MRLDISTTIEMPYPGSAISKNHMYNGGARGQGLNRVAKEWRATLVEWLMALSYYNLAKHVQRPVQLEIGARFRTRRTECDLHNLVELIADAVQDGIGIDDKHFTVSTHPPTFGHTEPVILVTVKLVIEA